ncbi:MAG: flagellar biosynthetic protein FliO [Desulfobacterales bacterium]|nr:flagellar biosynthetic protein FliO [Desulfobacterales bacterium]
MTDPATVAAPELWISLLKSMAMLFVVLGVLIATLYFMKRIFLNRGGVTDRGLIKILATSYVAPKERIMLVDVMGEKLLLGVTSQNINCLAKIESDREIEITNSNVPNGFFKNLLKGKMASTPSETICKDT